MVKFQHPLVVVEHPLQTLDFHQGTKEQLMHQIKLHLHQILHLQPDEISQELSLILYMVELDT